MVILLKSELDKVIEMALKFNKPKAAPTQESNTPVVKQQETAPAQTPVKTQPSAQTTPPKSGGLKFVKRGKAAAQVMAQEEKKAENKMSAVYAFWMKPNSDTSLTFIDGDLDGDTLNIPFIYQHHLNMNGKWGNFFICTQDVEPCPICEGGNNASYVGVFTVIDHTEFVSKKDGTKKKDIVRILYAKRDTIKQLHKLAVKRGGLAGCRFDVSRTGDKSPSCGNVYDFTTKLTPQQMKATYGDKANPPDYDKILGAMFVSAKDLRKMGFGSMIGAVGSESAPSEDDFSGEM